MFDDIEPKKKDRWQKNIETFSVDELQDYIMELKIEIVRVEADIAKKEASKQAADKFFK